MAEPPPIVVISGPPGAGKTTVARRLADAWPAPAVHLRFDDFLMAIRAGYVLPWLPDAGPQNRMVTRAFVGAALVYAVEGYAVVLDGVIGPWFLDLYREAAATAGADLSYVVLRPDRAAAVARARDRASAPMAEYPLGLFDGFTGLGALEAHVIDTTTLDVDAVAERIRAGLADGAFRLSS